MVSSYDPDKVPTIVTDAVSTLISDSGITRYRLEADEWQMYDRAKEPFWYFPKGIFLERFDLDFNVEATVKADSAWFFSRENLWKLNGNVHIENMVGEQFDSQEFYWDRKNGKVYSDTYIEIRRGLMLIKAVGFRSNQELTDWDIISLYDSQIPFVEESGAQPADSLDFGAPLPEN